MGFKYLLKQFDESSILDIVWQVVPQTRASDHEGTFTEQNCLRRWRNDEATVRWWPETPSWWDFDTVVSDKNASLIQNIYISLFESNNGWKMLIVKSLVPTVPEMIHEKCCIIAAIILTCFRVISADLFFICKRVQPEGLPWFN